MAIIKKENTMIILVVDTQIGIMNEHLYNFHNFVSNIKSLLVVARQHNIEVIYVRHDDGVGSSLTKGLEAYEIYEECKPKDKEKIFDKTVNSPFKDTGLLEYLQDAKVKDIIVVGLQTDYCIDASVKCGFEHGFHIIVPEGTNTTIDNQYMTGKESYEYYNSFIWKHRYADCLPIDKVIQMMERNTDIF